MEMVVDGTGMVRCLYSEEIDLPQFGSPAIRRASYVEPDDQGQWYADLSPVGGPKLGPFDRRTEALAAEREWLEANWLIPAKDIDRCREHRQFVQAVRT